MRATRSAGGAGASAGDAGTFEDAAAPPLSKLQLTLRYQRSELEKLSLKITLPLSWEARSCREALIEPFLHAYEQKFPEAAAHGPFEQLRLRYWDGPRPSMAECFADPKRPSRTKRVQELLAAAAAPAFCLLSVDEPASALRAAARGGHALHIELVAAESTALLAQRLPSSALVATGERLIRLMQDPEVDPQAMHALLDCAVSDAGQLGYAGVAVARDRRGRTALQLAVTRGDLTLCRKLMWRPDDILAMDDNRDSALSIACIAGRALIVRELLQRGALVHEKNCDLMNPLQLACVDEAQGNGRVVQMLIEAGADMNAKCWDVTPLMAAAAAGHHWAVQTLLELGADAKLVNGCSMAALDYSRDCETAQLISDFLSGELLPSGELCARREATRRSQQAHGVSAELPGLHEKAPRRFQSMQLMPLDEAFRNLGLPDEWVDAFRASGKHYAQIRLAWRKLVLSNHPDKQPKGLEGDELEEVTAAFTQAMCSFEAVDAFFHEHHTASAEANETQ